MKGKGHGEKRSRKEDRAILALCSEPTIKAAAEKVGVAESTLWRWMQDENFKKKYTEAKRQQMAHATSLLRHGMFTGVVALIEIAENNNSPAMARVVASKALVEYGLKAHELEDLQDRIERLEESMEGNAS